MLTNTTSNKDISEVPWENHGNFNIKFHLSSGISLSVSVVASISDRHGYRWPGLGGLTLIRFIAVNPSYLSQFWAEKL